MFAVDLLSKVVSVLDGDTIEVLHNQYPERIRLTGKRAKQAASELIFGKDKYGRTIADVLLPDGINVNHILVRDTWC
jgi:micrococcal nuclease